MINITAVSIDLGIVTLIEPSGYIERYRQRGIGSLSMQEQNHEVQAGRLHPQWRRFKELPRNYHIEYEDEEIMGKAKATYGLVLKKRRIDRKRTQLGLK